MNDLPDKLLIRIFLVLSAKDKHKNVVVVSKKFKSILKSEFFCKEKCLKAHRHPILNYIIPF